jgi:tRNA 2-thiouridine synthesizing protein D
MNISIAVHGDPANSEAPSLALRFARAAVAKGHRIHRVFFYHAAVALANSMVVQPQGEADVADEWAEFGREHRVELAVCIAAALRRGVLSDEDAEHYDRVGANLKSPFRIVGLGQWVDAIVESDRVVTFPA